MSCENCGHLSYELAGCQYELGITTSERDTLRQQLAERDAAIEEWSGTAVQNGMECDRLTAQRDKLAGLLRESLEAHKMWADVAPAVSLCADIDAALAEVNKP